MSVQIMVYYIWIRKHHKKLTDPIYQSKKPIHLLIDNFHPTARKDVVMFARQHPIYFTNI